MSRFTFRSIMSFKALLIKLKQQRLYRCYSKLLPYIRPYAFRAIIAMALCIPIGSLDAVIAMSLKPYTDLVMVQKSAQAAWYIPFIIIGFAAVQGVLNYFAAYLNTWVGEHITRDLKFDLFKKLLNQDSVYFDKTYSGDVVSTFNIQVDVASSGILAKIKMLLSRIFSSISLVFVLFYNSWKLSIIATIILGIAFLPTAKIRKKIRDTLNKVIKGSARLVTEYNETFSGNKIITAYNLQQYQESKFLKVLGNVVNVKIKLTQKTAWLSPVMHVIVSLGLALSITYGSHLIVTNQITSGNFVSFLTALIMLYNPVKNLGNSIKDFQMSLFANEQVFDALNAETKIKNSKDAIEFKKFKKHIKFKNVNFEYVPGIPVLKSFNLKMKRGETIALVGNSGGGKSTIASLLPRFYDIQSGSITIDGVDIRNYTLKSLRDNIAVVFQDNFLFSGTIRENIMLGNNKATEADIKKAVSMAYLDEFIATLQDGLDTEIGERGILLSGGQRQRVAIARAFLKNAPILILDEATSALDNKSEAVVQKAIENLMLDKTVLVIAHRLSTIKNATKIAVISDGAVVEFGSHKELMSIENGQYKALYDMQFQTNN